MKKVIIKNFTMPKGCLDCDFKERRWDGWADCKLNYSNFPLSNTFKTERLSDCPLEEIEVKE